MKNKMLFIVTTLICSNNIVNTTYLQGAKHLQPTSYVSITKKGPLINQIRKKETITKNTCNKSVVMHLSSYVSLENNMQSNGGNPVSIFIEHSSSIKCDHWEIRRHERIKIYKNETINVPEHCLKQKHLWLSNGIFRKYYADNDSPCYSLIGYEKTPLASFISSNRIEGKFCFSFDPKYGYLYQFKPIDEIVIAQYNLAPFISDDEQ